ncbi:hypothetical protein RF11_02316 [Thelohanellus kitauei]|uniref:Tc1-like transposase DDE domain-containing protein n=1 Tax=Thelohanellus kitauei TaxID=669202 RepID=A0A0C2N7V4_THEKT|nr:hypothetical protein RF11_02316 [Thelohanellus kitauei]
MKSNAVHYKYVFGPYYTEKVIIFYEMCRNIIDGIPKTFIMDNVRFHHSAEVSAFLQTRGHNIIFLPAYSTQLNPIELLFSKWKAIVKRSITVFDNQRLLEVLRSASTEITQNHFPTDKAGDFIQNGLFLRIFKKFHSGRPMVSFKADLALKLVKIIYMVRAAMLLTQSTLIRESNPRSRFLRSEPRFPRFSLLEHFNKIYSFQI